MLIIAKLVVREGQAEAFLSAFAAYRALVIAHEPDTALFDVFRDAGSQFGFTILELFRHEAAYAHHNSTSYRDACLALIRAEIADGSASTHHAADAEGLLANLGGGHAVRA